MADPSRTELIALLARYAADGVLDQSVVLEAIRELAGEPGADDPGATALLEVLQQQSAPEPGATGTPPAITDLAGHVRARRLAAAVRYHAQRRRGAVDLEAFESLLGDLPLDAPVSFSVENPSLAALESAVSLARDRRFLLSRRDDAPEMTVQLEREYGTAAAAALPVLVREGGWLIGELIDEVRRRLRDDRITDEGRPLLAATLDRFRTELESTPGIPRPTPLETDPEDAPEVDPGDDPGDDREWDELRLLEEQFQQADFRDEQEQVLDTICSWPTRRSAEFILRLAAEDAWVRERAELILVCRFGSPPVGGWRGWENLLLRQSRRQQDELRRAARQEPGELLVLWATRQPGLDPQVVGVLERWCEARTTRVGVEAFVERWVDVLSPTEFNSLVRMEIELIEPDGPAVTPPEQLEPVPPAAEPVPAEAGPGSPAAPTTRTPPTREPPPVVSRPVKPPPPAGPSIWDEHVRPFLTENWIMVAGVVLLVAGMSLIALFFGDKHWAVRFTFLPILLAAFTVALAAAGSWIERQDSEFRGTAAVLRGAAIALLPINFMAVAGLANDIDVPQTAKQIFVPLMCLVYLALGGWGLRTWCRAVYEPLGGLLGGTLLFVNTLVMVGPLAGTWAGGQADVVGTLIAIGFHAGFVLIAWVVVRFAREMLTPELVRERRVPWFVGGTLIIVFLQVFGWVQYELGELPRVETYALLVILIGWLMLFVERRAIELAGEGKKLVGESFLGYALVLLGVLMGSFDPGVRIAVLSLAAVVWLYQGMGRDDELQHWIGLTFLTAAGAAIGLLEVFPQETSLPVLGLALVLVMNGVDRLAQRFQQPLLSRAAIGMQPTLALLTVVVAMLAQWQYHSEPWITAAYLLAAVGVFAWRGWRDDALRWVHSAMAIVGLSLLYLGFADMSRGVDLHGNTMVFGLAIVSCGWLALVAATKAPLLLKARSTVLWVYGSVAVAAMVLRVLFEDVSGTDLTAAHQAMDYIGPLLMAAVLTVTTYYSRSLVPAAMAAVITVILFPELRAQFHETFNRIGWGTGIGSSISGLLLVLACFQLKQADWLRELDTGDRFLGRIPFPCLRFDHTLFTWPLAASAAFLVVRVDTLTIFRNALPTASSGSLAQLVGLDLSLIGPRTAVAVGLTGVTWTLLSVLFRSMRGATGAMHLGWISLLAGCALGFPHLFDDPHWSWPFLATGLVLQGLDFFYRQRQSAHPWLGKLLADPTRQVVGTGSLLLAIACVVLLVIRGQQEFLPLAPLLVFVFVQLVLQALATRHLVFGSFLFVLTWVCLLSGIEPGSGPLLSRIGDPSLYATIGLLLSILFGHLALELSRLVHDQLSPFLKPFLAWASIVTVALVLVSLLDAIATDEYHLLQRWLLVAATLAAARIHGSAWLGMLGLLQAYVFLHAGLLEQYDFASNLAVLFEPWRCGALALVVASIGQAGHLLDRRRPGVLRGPFAQPVFASASVAWLFVPAVGFAVLATGNHGLSAPLRDHPQHLVSPFLAAISVTVVAYSCRSQALAWLATVMLALGNIHLVRYFYPDLGLPAEVLSDLHLISLGIVAALLELTALRKVWRRERVAVFANRACLAGAGLVLILICVRYVTDPGLSDFHEMRFVVSGAMAYVAGWYFRLAARQPGPGEKSFGKWCEAAYHFGVTLAIWCAALLALKLTGWLNPTVAIYALAAPIGYFYARAEQGMIGGSPFARRYRDSASTLSVVILGLWLFRGVLQVALFPDKSFDVISYHVDAPLLILLSLVMLRLHGLGGDRWLAFSGGLALMVGSFFTLTWIEQWRLIDHPIEAAWCAVGLAHFWILVSHQRSPLRTAVQQVGRIDGPHWLTLRRSWGVCLAFGTHVAVLWGLVEALGSTPFANTEANELMAAPLVLGAASVLIYQAAVRRSLIFFFIALTEIVLAMHAEFVGVTSHLKQGDVVWAILAAWVAGLVAWQFSRHGFQQRKLGTTSAVLAGMTLAHVVLHHQPHSPVGLWAFALGAILATLTPRYTRAVRSVEETAAASMLLIVPTWLVFFSQVDLSVPLTAEQLTGRLLGLDGTWPLLAGLAAIFATGSLCRAFQARWLPGYDAWHRTNPRLFDQTLSLAGSSGAAINSAALWVCFLASVVVQLRHYGAKFEPHELMLICALYASYSVSWFFEGRLRRTMSAYIVLQLCVLGFFAVIRRQLMLEGGPWTVHHDVWASLVVSFALCGAKQVIDLRPREVRIPLLGTLLVLPVVALVWVVYNQMDSRVALIVVGLHSFMFTFLGKDDRESPYHIVGVAGFVTFVLVYFLTQTGIRDLHAFVIPVGLGVLVLLQLFHSRIDVETRNHIRMVTLLAMLGTAGFYALSNSQPDLVYNATLIVLCLLAMGLGGLLQVRVYVVMGFAALMVDIASILFRVISLADALVQRGVIGGLFVLIAIPLLAGPLYYKAHRERIDERIDRWRQRLGAWE